MKQMSRKELLSHIWQEKREKVVSNTVYPVGLSITIEDLNFSWHTVIYNILSLLRKNVEQALEWSRNWGRSTVWVHPLKSLSFCFTRDESQEEKLGAFISTEKVVNPANFLDSRHNVGNFKILLNWQIMSLEAAILQIERMVDELVWCNFLQLKHKSKKIDEVILYAEALEEIWNGGVVVKYVSENLILNMKRIDMSLPVRVYGDVLESNKVPHIIGAAIIPPNKIGRMPSSKILENYRSGLLENNAKKSTEVLDCQTSLEIKLTDKNICVCIGVTPAKELHVGHILLFAYADMVRRLVESSSPLYLESNNVGDRIFGLIAKLSERRQSPVKETITALTRNEIGSKEINLCYQSRLKKGDLVQQAKQELKDCNIGLLSLMEKRIDKSLVSYGFLDVVIITDSSCRNHYNKLIKTMGNSWAKLGFRFLKYRNGSHKKMLVLEQQGVPTASASRASFIVEVISRQGEKTLPIVVDADTSISQARDIVKLVTKKDILQTEGAAIGFEMKIASGTVGEALSADVLFESFCKRYSLKYYPSFFISVLTFFLLTRYSTAKCHKKHLFDKYHLSGLSFFDYKDNRAFEDDFFLCAEELINFKALINRVQKTIRSRILTDEEGIRIDRKKFSQKRAEYLLIKLMRIGQENKIEQLLLKPKILTPDPHFRRIREMIYQRSNTEDQHQSTEKDRIIVEAIIRGCNTLGDINKIFLLKKIILSPIPGDQKQRLSCVFVENLRSRGYGEKEVVNLSVRYLHGDFCLIRKRCVFFEHLREIIRMTKALKSIDNIKAELVIRSMSICLRKLGL